MCRLSENWRLTNQRLGPIDRGGREAEDGWRIIDLAVHIRAPEKPVALSARSSFHISAYSAHSQTADDYHFPTTGKSPA